MRSSFLFALIYLLLHSLSGTSQTGLKEFKVGHTFNVSLPAYMNKTGGLNSAAAIQYKNAVKDVAGFIIYDTKEELRLVEMEFASITEFYEEFIKDFLQDEEKVTISPPVSKMKGEINYLECDASYYDKEVEMEIYYLVGIVETSKCYYKVLSWCSLENKDKFKEDFRKIIYSISD